MHTVGSSSPARRRGRPYRFPEDLTALTRVHGGVDQRVAWLLSASRIYATDTDLAYRDKFVEVLKAHGYAADQARVSRWESGALRVPDRVITAYETVLGFAPSHLASVVHGLRRSQDPTSYDLEPVATPPAQLHAELDALFERVDGDAAHGSDWIALTNYIATHPQVYMQPRSWEQLAETLIRQMGRSVGPAYLRRFEALRTLIRHPSAQRHVVKTIGAFVTDPAGQVVMHPLTLLQEVEDPRAGQLAIRMLTSATGMLQQGAAWTTAVKVARGHFDEDPLTRLEGMLVMLLGAGSRSLSEMDVLDIVARLPESASHRLSRAIRESTTVKRLDMLLKTGEILPENVTRRVATAAATRAQELTDAPYRVEPDLMLQRLVREALFHGHQERRHLSGVLLTVSPYRDALGTALAEAIDTEDEDVAYQAVLLMRYLAPDGQRADLRRRSAAPIPERLRGVAILTLGRLSAGVLDEEEPLIRAALEGARPAMTRSCVYALGMSGSSMLKELADSDSEFLRRAAGWWLRTGPAIHEPAHNSRQT